MEKASKSPPSEHLDRCCVHHVQICMGTELQSMAPSRPACVTWPLSFSHQTGIGTHRSQNWQATCFVWSRGPHTLLKEDRGKLGKDPGDLGSVDRFYSAFWSLPMLC